MIFRHRAMIDEAWQKIAEATVAGKLGCFSKVVNIASQLLRLIAIAICSLNSFD